MEPLEQENIIKRQNDMPTIKSEPPVHRDVNLKPELIEFRKKQVLVLGDIPVEKWESIFEPKFREVVNNKRLRVNVVGLVIEYKPDSVEDYFVLFGVPHNPSTSLFVYHDLTEKLEDCPFTDEVMRHFGIKA